MSVSEVLELKKCCQSRLSTATLFKEYLLFSKMLLRVKNQQRHDLSFQKMAGVSRKIKKYLVAINLYEKYQTIITELLMGTICNSTIVAVEELYDLFLKAAKFTANLLQFIEETYKEVHQRLQRALFVPFNTVMLSSLSRLWVCIRLHLLAIGKTYMMMTRAVPQAKTNVINIIVCLDETQRKYLDVPTIRCLIPPDKSGSSSCDSGNQKGRRVAINDVGVAVMLTEEERRARAEDFKSKTQIQPTPVLKESVIQHTPRRRKRAKRKQSKDQIQLPIIIEGSTPSTLAANCLRTSTQASPSPQLLTSPLLVPGGSFQTRPLLQAPPPPAQFIRGSIITNSTLTPIISRPKAHRALLATPTTSGLMASSAPHIPFIRGPMVPSILTPPVMGPILPNPFHSAPPTPFVNGSMMPSRAHSAPHIPFINRSLHPALPWGPPPRHFFVDDSIVPSSPFIKCTQLAASSPVEKRGCQIQSAAFPGPSTSKPQPAESVSNTTKREPVTEKEKIKTKRYLKYLTKHHRMKILRELMSSSHQPAQSTNSNPHRETVKINTREYLKYLTKNQRKRVLKKLEASTQPPVQGSSDCNRISTKPHWDRKNIKTKPYLKYLTPSHRKRVLRKLKLQKKQLKCVSNPTANQPPFETPRLSNSGFGVALASSSLPPAISSAAQVPATSSTYPVISQSLIQPQFEIPGPSNSGFRVASASSFSQPIISGAAQVPAFSTAGLIPTTSNAVPVISQSNLLNGEFGGVKKNDTVISKKGKSRAPAIHQHPYKPKKGKNCSNKEPEVVAIQQRTNDNSSGGKPKLSRKRKTGGSNHDVSIDTADNRDQPVVQKFNHWRKRRKMDNRDFRSILVREQEGEGKRQLVYGKKAIPDLKAKKERRKKNRMSKMLCRAQTSNTSTPSASSLLSRGPAAHFGERHKSGKGATGDAIDHIFSNLA